MTRNRRVIIPQFSNNIILSKTHSDKMEILDYLVIFLFIISLLKYSTSRNNAIIRRYTDHGVIYLGNFMTHIIKIFLEGKHYSDSLTEKYTRVKKANQKFGFELSFGKPSFFITDLELLKQITIKNFDNFTQTLALGTYANTDDLVGRMAISFLGPKWRAIRAKVWSISSNVKIKRQFPIMDSSGKKFVNYLKTQIQEDRIINLEGACVKFTIDFITSASFGWDTKVFENKTPSIFEKIALNIRINIPRIAFYNILASISRFLPDLIGYSVIDRKTQAFFRDQIRNTVKARERNRDTKHNDIIELMLEIRDEQENYKPNREIDSDTQIPMDDEDIAAYCFSFFFAGFETVPIALQLAAYNLVLYPEAQERLFQELQTAVKQNNGEINYEIINKLEYLNGVISESLRIISIGPATQRVCTKAFHIPDTSIIIPEGSRITIPISPILNDPDYFPNPEKFDPERFIGGNYSNMNAIAYIPFSQGPRMCPGMKLAVTELKTAISHLVLNFVLVPCSKTQIPLQFDRISTTMKPGGGVWLKLEPRT